MQTILSFIRLIFGTWLYFRCTCLQVTRGACCRLGCSCPTGDAEVGSLQCLSSVHTCKWSINRHDVIYVRLKGQYGPSINACDLSANSNICPSHMSQKSLICTAFTVSYCLYWFYLFVFHRLSSLSYYIIVFVIYYLYLLF